MKKLILTVALVSTASSAFAIRCQTEYNGVGSVALKIVGTQEHYLEQSKNLTAELKRVAEAFDKKAQEGTVLPTSNLGALVGRVQANEFVLQSADKDLLEVKELSRANSSDLYSCLKAAKADCADSALRLGDVLQTFAEFGRKEVRAFEAVAEAFGNYSKEFDQSIERRIAIPRATSLINTSVTFMDETYNRQIKLERMKYEVIEGKEFIEVINCVNK